MSPETVQRKLAALLSADVVGYSRLMAQNEVATVKILNAHRDAVGGLIRRALGCSPVVAGVVTDEACQEE